MNYKALVKYLNSLKKNNNKEWFDNHRPQYDELRKEFSDFVSAVIMGIIEFDPDLMNIEAKKCIFRINRDVRFSKNKNPYKTQFAAAIGPSGKGGGDPIYYFHFAANGEFTIAGGVYQPDAEVLRQIRNFICEEPEKISQIIKDKKIKSRFGTIEGDSLKRLPKGFLEDAPHQDLLKKKRFILYEDLDLNTIDENIVLKRITDDFKIMYPFMLWLKEALKH